MQNREVQKEYCIYIKNGLGSPYIISPYSSFSEALSALNIMVDYEEELNHFYYVDNDFFNNRYPASMYGKYFCIQERTVSKWSKYESFISNKNQKNKKDNIIFFKQKLKWKRCWNYKFINVLEMGRVLSSLFSVNTTLHKIKVLCKKR